jgi:hypothetical protein
MYMVEGIELTETEETQVIENRGHLLIWWTSQKECEEIGGNLPASAPEYLRKEYPVKARSRWTWPALGSAVDHGQRGCFVALRG